MTFASCAVISSNLSQEVSIIIHLNLTLGLFTDLHKQNRCDLVHFPVTELKIQIAIMGML